MNVCVVVYGLYGRFVIFFVSGCDINVMNRGFDFDEWVGFVVIELRVGFVVGVEVNIVVDSIFVMDVMDIIGVFFVIGVERIIVVDVLVNSFV